MPALSFQQKVMLTGHYGIVLCRAVDEAGQRFFHYLKAERKEVERLLRDYDKGTPLDFASYGEIIYSGWGENPTPEEVEMIRKKFGTDF